MPRPEGWQHNPVTGHDYLYFGGARPWVEAEAYAVSLGGHLVTINNAAEDAWLVATFGTEYFIGFNDRAVEGARDGRAASRSRSRTGWSTSRTTLRRGEESR